MDIRALIAMHLPPERVPSRVRLIDDTSDFFRVDYDDVLVLEGRYYFIRNFEREGRFGIDDEPKFWVRRAIDLQDGSTKVIKMVFLERFDAHVGELSFPCLRSPEKEARVLDVVQGHQNFMQGVHYLDRAQNLIRVLDFIKGPTLADHIHKLGTDHRQYFDLYLPGILKHFRDLVAAIGLLHAHGLKHGDIRRDHALLDKTTSQFRWIDFDFDYMHKESPFGYDLFGLGNMLMCIVGRGDITLQGLEKTDPDALSRLTQDDMNIIFQNRVTNIKKIYDYIPEPLNQILMHFSNSARVYYRHTDELLQDLDEAK